MKSNGRWLHFGENWRLSIILQVKSSLKQTIVKVAAIVNIYLQNCTSAFKNFAQIKNILFTDFEIKSNKEV